MLHWLKSILILGYESRKLICVCQTLICDMHIMLFDFMQSWCAYFVFLSYSWFPCWNKPIKTSLKVPLAIGRTISVNIFWWIYWCETNQGPRLQTKLTKPALNIWISDYIHTRLWGVNCHPSPNANGGLPKLSLKVMESHPKMLYIYMILEVGFRYILFTHIC